MKKIIYVNDNRKIYMNKENGIIIIEINPEKDGIYNFLELDEDFFKKDIELKYKNSSAYILQAGERIKDFDISYGIIQFIDKSFICHLCSTSNGSGGAPIMNLKNLKIIGIHKGYYKDKNFNIGIFLKDPINDFINKNKDYIESINESQITFSIGRIENINNDELEDNKFNKMNNELENSLKKEKEKNKDLEEQINKLKILLNNTNDNIKNYNDLNNNKKDELIESVLKKDKEIDDLKSKLARFPFELSDGEKLMSIIFTSIDQIIHCSIICKNTDIFSSIEAKLYKIYHEYSENENFFTVNGKKINKNKDLDYNTIKDNDIVILNVID